MADLGDHLSHLLDVIERRHHIGDEPRPSVPSGVRGIDEITGGVGPGGWLIRSGPGLGGSALIVGFVLSTALRPSRPVVHLVTADLSPHELTLRLLRPLRVSRSIGSGRSTWTPLTGRGCRTPHEPCPGEM